MSELTGPELRRAALEATGWNFKIVGDYCFTYGPDGQMCGELKHRDFWGAVHAAAAVESNPAVSEPWFLEWCGKNGYHWTVGQVVADTVCCSLIPASDHETSIEVTGATPSEARARAVVASHQKGGA